MLELNLESNVHLIFTNQTGAITFVLQKYTREEHACVHDVGLKYVLVIYAYAIVFVHN